MNTKGLDGWNDVDKIHSYVVCGSRYFEHSWVGKLIDVNGKAISIFGMVQDEIGVSLDREYTEKVTRMAFDHYVNMNKKYSENRWLYIKTKDSNCYISFSTAEESYGVHLTNKKEDACAFTTKAFALEFLETNELEHTNYIIS